MRAYGTRTYLKKNFLDESQKNAEKISKLNFELIHKMFDSFNISLLVLIFTLFLLSLDSQKKWSDTYKILSKTRQINNNLIDYISKTEEFYIRELESLSSYKKTKPKDLIYLEKNVDKKERLFKKNLKIFTEGIADSKYQRGY